MIEFVGYGFNGLTDTITHVSIRDTQLLTDLKVNSFNDSRVIIKAIEDAYNVGRNDMKTHIQDLIEGIDVSD